MIRLLRRSYSASCSKDVSIIVLMLLFPAICMAGSALVFEQARQRGAASKAATSCHQSHVYSFPRFSSGFRDRTTLIVRPFACTLIEGICPTEYLLQC